MKTWDHDLVGILYCLREKMRNYELEAESGRHRDPVQRLHHLEDMQENVCDQMDRALQILRHVRKSSMTSAQLSGKVGGNKKKASLLETTKKVLKKLEDEYTLAEGQILLRIPDSFPHLECRKADLQEILHHLLKNAIQSFKQNSWDEKEKSGLGTIVLRAELTCWDGKIPALRITVADQGKGTSMEEMRSLFEPFFSTKAIGDGNGLGLYLCRQLVERNGGKMSASGYHGNGMAFTVEFPSSE